MTDFNLNDPKSTATVVDDLISQVAGSVIRHGVTLLAGALATAGAIQTDQQAQFIAIASSMALYAASQVWSIVSKIRRTKKP